MNARFVDDARICPATEEVARDAVRQEIVTGNAQLVDGAWVGAGDGGRHLEEHEA